MIETLQSVARVVMLKAHLAGTATPATGKTIAVTISKAGGAFANPNAGATNATEVSAGWYKVTLDTTDTGTLGDLVVKGTEGTIDPVERVFSVVAATNRGMTALPNAAADAAGGLPISDAGGLDLDNRMPAAAAITNLNTVFNTDFAANYDTTNDVWNVSVTHVDGTGVDPAGTVDANVKTFDAGALTAAAIAAGALNGKGDWNIGKTGYSLTQSFPANFAALAINASGHIERVVLVDTTTTNSDMRGTDSAATAAALASLVTTVGAAGAGLTEAGGTGDHLTALAQASVCTEARLAELDAANLPADVAAVKSDTAAILLDTGTDGVVVAAGSKSGYALSATGLDLIVPADPSAIPVLGTSSIVVWNGWFAAHSVNKWISDATDARLRNSADNADLATFAHSDDGTDFTSGEPT